MFTSLTRRSFIATTALTAATLGLQRGAWAAAHTPLLLSATSRTLEVDGRAASVWGLVNAQGGIGLTLDPGQRFRVDLTNALDVDTIIHWHDQTPPNAQDGVPDLPLLKPGEMRLGAGAADGVGYRGGGRERAILRFRRIRTLQNVRIDPHLGAQPLSDRAPSAAPRSLQADPRRQPEMAGPLRRAMAAKSSISSRRHPQRLDRQRIARLP